MRFQNNRIIGVMILVASFAGGWFIMDWQSFISTSLVEGDHPVRLTIAPGSSLTGLAYRLHKARLVKHPRYLVWLARWQGKAGLIQAGEYEIMPGTTPAGLLDQIVSGKVIQYPFTIIEGWTFLQLREALAAQHTMTSTLTGLSDAEIMEKIGHPGEHPEGQFLPDTYYVTRDMTDVELLSRAHAAMTEMLDQAWQERDVGLPYQQPYDALIMASIIEKETAVPEERERIAGVFVRRLEKGMRLQTDPTVIYGLGPSFNGNLRRRDLQQDNPYNTYRHRGLPPTPIAMPGHDSILAAMHPAQGDEIYFVARGDGTHYFSSTVEEHNRAVRKYQLHRR